ncbi:MAG: hypothetical protein BGO43_08885 [Gammaproteobacteria bacterium 39-13]|nr:hypothetical protein [Gammaproteobacteria bacterium]OJV94355.1 MAG: hypothetical protein BGO43_08885 [Gammaproteobacteria bacterium 39-13]
MENHLSIFNWATNYLNLQGYSVLYSPETVVETPWSSVFRFSTSKGNVYLKQTAPSLFLEPKIMQLLTELHCGVPIVITINDELHCFLMKEAGESLREYLKADFQPNLLHQAIKQFTAIQRSTENQIEVFFALGVPDWRLDKLATLYENIINQTEFLKADGITDKELKILHDLSPKVLEQCELLSQYQIPETLVQPDFNTNNILFNQNTKDMTLIDLGEIAITHPFFSLHNFLLQATIHHSVKEQDKLYYQLQASCLENWLELKTKDHLLEAFGLIKKLWPIYSALAYYRLMTSVDLPALNAYYAHRPNRFAGYFRQYAASCGF